MIVKDGTKMEEIRFAANNLCSDLERRKVIRFVSASLCLTFKDGKKYEFLPQKCVCLSVKDGKM